MQAVRGALESKEFMILNGVEIIGGITRSLLQ